jgi:hypothetical protein
MDDNYIPGGFIIKARAIENSKISTAPPCTRETWNWLLLNANHKDGKTKGGFAVMRGQLFCRYRHIIEGLSWHVGFKVTKYSTSQMKATMKYLRNELMVTTHKHRQGVMITICNYDKFQTITNYTQTNEQTDEQTNGDPTQTPDMSDKKQERKERKEEKNVNKEYPLDILNFVTDFQNYIKSEKNNLAPKITDSLIKNGCDSVDKLIRLDNFTLDFIINILKWAVKDDFWSGNVLSLASLRKSKNGTTKFQKIANSFKRDSGGTGDKLLDNINKVHDKIMMED